MASGIQFAEQPRSRNAIYSRPMRFDMICDIESWLRHRFEKPWRGGIEHRPTKPHHPWSREDQKTVRGTVFLSGARSNG